MFLKANFLEFSNLLHPVFLKFPFIVFFRGINSTYTIGGSLLTSLVAAFVVMIVDTGSNSHFASENKHQTLN